MNEEKCDPKRVITACSIAITLSIPGVGFYW